jgi:hypothetical protein
VQTIWIVVMLYHRLMIVHMLLPGISTMRIGINATPLMT